MEVLWIILIAIVSTYVFVAVTLFIFPSLIHTPATQISSAVKSSAHRGGAGEFIENTMAAFNNSAQLGIDMLEIDVQQTKDEVVVVAHDNDLFRATGKRGKISDTLFSELPNYKSQLSLDFDRVMCTSNQNDLKFVKLDELFEKHNNMVVHIDTKEGGSSLIKTVSELVLKHKRLEKTIWGNMEESRNNECYAVNKKIPLFFSIKKVVFVYVMFYMGLIGFVPLKESFFTIPFLRTGLEKFSDMLTFNQRITLKIIDFMSMNRILFWHLHQRGIKVVLFVLNSKKMFTAAGNYNTDGIMTDFPSQLMEFCNINHQQEKSFNKVKNTLDT